MKKIKLFYYSGIKTVTADFYNNGPVAKICLCALNDHLLKTQPSLEKQFYGLDYYSKGAVTVLVDYTGAHAVPNDPRILELLADPNDNITAHKGSAENRKPVTPFNKKQK